MIINAKIDNSALLRRFKNPEKTLVYTTVGGLNDTALQIQKAEREHVEQALEVRSKTRAFIMREIAKIAFASVKRGLLFAEVYVGQKPRLLLAQLEGGGVKAPAKGGSVGVPITGSAARPSFPASVPEHFYFRNLNLRKRKSAKAQSLRALQGDHETYVVPGVGVFRRIGPDEGQTEMIYAFVENPKLKARLGFVKTAKATAEKWLRENIEARVVKALGRERGL